MNLNFMANIALKFYIMKKLPTLKSSLINENPLILYILNRNKVFLPTSYSILNIEHCQIEIPGSGLK